MGLLFFLGPAKPRDAGFLPDKESQHVRLEWTDKQGIEESNLCYLIWSQV